MNIKQLEVFIAICETGSFSRAGERTSLTQSTVSQHVAALEADFGVRLLDRTGRGALPTEAGKVLREHAKDVIAALQATQQGMGRFARSEGVSLFIAASTIPGTYLVPAAAARLKTALPGVNLKVVIADSAAVLEYLARGAVEIGVFGCPVKDERLQGEVIGQDRIILIAPADHPWRHIQLAELVQEPLILREAGSGSGRAVEAALRHNGVEMAALRAAMELSSSEAVRQAVLAGCGVAFISEVAVRGDLAAGTLREVAVQGLDIRRDFTLARLKGRTLSPAAGEFSAVLRQIASRA
jgi:DNA-binding transcriptional LysR family regulator